MLNLRTSALGAALLVAMAGIAGAQGASANHPRREIVRDRHEVRVDRRELRADARALRGDRRNVLKP